MILMVTANQTPIIDTQKSRDKNPSVTLKKAIKAQGERSREERSREP